ncbi:universal stress protein [Amycolatopsis sp. NPDC004368]
MSRPARDPMPIIAGVDGSAEALDAVRWAARAAVRHRLPLELAHATALTDLMAAEIPPPEEVTAALRQRGRHHLRVAHELANAAGALEVRERIDHDRAAPALLDLAGSASWVVVGARHGRFTGLLVGSVSAALAAHAPCPVAIVRGTEWDEPGPARPVLAGIDGGPAAAAVAEAAFAEADTLGVPLVAVRATFDEPARGEDPDAGPALEDHLAAPARRHPSVSVDRVVVAHRPRHELLAKSRHAQLVVIGDRGREGFPRLLLGSTAQALLNHAACPVLIVRTDSAPR